MKPAVPPLLELHGVGLRAGTKPLLDRLDLRVAAGQFWAVVGANGVGKTTLLMALAGLVAPQRGSVEMLGRPLRGWPPADAARVRGFLPQHLDSFFGMQVLQAALLGRHPHLHGRRWRLWESDADVELALAALDRVDLGGFAERDMASLSGGERQRAAIACLLTQAPRLYLLDEPLAHLDLRHQHALMQLLRELATGPGERAVVASVHDLSMAARFATHALVMADGSAIAGPADGVLTDATLSAAFGHPVRRLDAGGSVAVVAL